MQFLDLEVELTSFAEQVIFHDVEVRDGCPERARYLSQRMEPPTIDDQGCDVNDECCNDITWNPNPRAVQQFVGVDHGDMCLRFD